MLARLASWKTLKSGVLLFWAAGFTPGRVVPAGFTFVSGNWELMLKVTAVHGTPVAVVGVLFLGALVWEALAAVLFWRACLARGRGGIAAFTVGLALWAAFTLADELFIA